MMKSFLNHKKIFSYSSIGKFQVMLVHILSKQSCPNKILPPHVVFAKSKKFCEECLSSVGGGEASKLSSPLYRILKISFAIRSSLHPQASAHFSIPQIDSPLIHQGYRPFVYFDNFLELFIVYLALEFNVYLTLA